MTNKMGTLSFFPLSLTASLRAHNSPSKTKPFNPILCPHVSSTSFKSLRFVGRTIAFGSNTSNPKESLFLDENGVVDDMDAYLNYLSLEYDSVWDTKPSWWVFPFLGLSIFHGYFTIITFCGCLFHRICYVSLPNLITFSCFDARLCLGPGILAWFCNSYHKPQTLFPVPVVLKSIK